MLDPVQAPDSAAATSEELDMVKQSLMVVSLLCCVAPSAAAQTQLVWEAAYNAHTTGQGGYPSYSDDEVLAATRDASGNVYLTGEAFWPWGPPYFRDPVTVKIDSAGHLVWAHRYAIDPASDAGHAIAVDPRDGSVYVGTSPFTWASPSSVVLLKYDANGALLWASAPYAPVGGNANITASSCVLDSAGNVYLGVTATGPSNDIVVLSHDPSGALRWSATIDGPAHLTDSAAALAIDASDRVYVLGTAGAAGPGTSTQHAAVVQLSTAGSVSWSIFQPSGTNGNASARAIDFDPAGDAYVLVVGPGEQRVVKFGAAGNTISSTPIAGAGISLVALAVDAFGAATAVGTSGNFPNQNLFVIHVDPSGTVAWNDLFDGPAHKNDYATDVAIDPAGEVVVVGSTQTNQQVNFQYNSDFLVRRYTAAGVLRSVYQHPDYSFDWAVAVFAGQAGELVVAGSRRTIASSQPLTFNTNLHAMQLGEAVQPICAADGSFGACPCGNASALGSGSGCANSIGQSAKLAGSGSASLASDSLVLTTSGELPTALSILLQGDHLVAPVAFGDGLRCIGGNLRRLFLGNAAGGVFVAPGAGDPTVSARSAALGDPLSAGSSRGYQTYYRDPDLAFCSAPQGNTWNAASGLRITWGS